MITFEELLKIKADIDNGVTGLPEPWHPTTKEEWDELEKSNSEFRIWLNEDFSERNARYDGIEG